MNKWIAEFELEDGDTMPEHMDLEYKGARIDFHCKPLKQEPTTKNDLGVDCISRADAIHAVSEALKRTFVEYEDIANKIIGKLPSVTPQEPKTGCWNDIPKYKDIAWQCSECERFTTMKHNYCPNCGCRMVEPQESEEI